MLRLWLLLLLQSEVDALRKKLLELQAAAESASADAVKAQQDASIAAAELTAVKSAKGSVETQLRQQIAARKADRDREVAMLADKLERALETCNR